MYMYRKTYRSGWHGAVNLLNKIYSYFGVIGAADTSIHDAGQATFHCTCSLSQSIFGMSIECCTESYQLPQISPGAVQFCSVTVQIPLEYHWIYCITL